MSNTQTKLFALLDMYIGHGSGCTFEDYDSREAILEEAIERVSESDNLTQGCGVGPLIGDIKTWLAAFENGERTQEDPDMPFCLQVQFTPADQGYALYRTEEQFLQEYPKPLDGHYRPQPWSAPDRYPVFAKELAVLNNPSGADHAILSYLYYDTLKFVA